MKKNIYYIFFIFFLSIAIYYNATKAFFVADDFFYIYNRNNLHYYSPLTKFFYQPITFVVYYLNYFWAGVSYSRYHLFTITLNAINNILLFYFIFLLIKNSFYSFIISLLATVYYFSADNIIWINCTNNVVCAFFYFLSLIFSIKFNLTKKNIFLYLTIISMFLTLFSREMGVSIFPMIILVDLFFFTNELKYYIKKKFIFLFLVFISYIFIMLIGPTYHNKRITFNRGNYEFEFTLKSIIININWFLFRTFIPCSFGSHFKIPLIIKITLFIRFHYISIIFVLIMALIVRNKIYYFGILWIIITASPYLLLNIYYVFNGDRYFYLPHIGLGIILLGFWLHFNNYNLIKKFYLPIKVLIFILLLFYSIGSIYAINKRINWWINAGKTSEKFLSAFKDKFPEIPDYTIFFIKDIPRWAENAPNKLIALINGTEFALRLFYNKKYINVIPYWDDYGEKNYENFGHTQIYENKIFLEYKNNNLVEWKPPDEYLMRIKSFIKK